MAAKKEKKGSSAMTYAEGREALAPLAQLLCACRLLGLGCRNGALDWEGRSVAAGQGAQSIRAAKGDGVCLPEIWAALGTEGAAPQPVSLGTILAERLPEDWPVGFIALAYKACEAAEALGEERGAMALSAVGASFEGKLKWGRGPVVALDAREADAWLIDGALDAQALMDVALDFKARGGAVSGKEWSKVEAGVLADAARAPDGGSGDAFKLRL